MHRRDEIDATLAKHFAWTFVRPGDTAQLRERLRAAEQAAAATAAEPTSDPPRPATGDLSLPGDDDAPGKSGSKAQARCRALAVSVDEAWSLPDENASLQATKRLLVRAERLGADLLEMREHSLQAVRFLRLLVRWAPKMTRRQRERGPNIATLVALDHPEVAELLLEVARAGDRAMADSLLADEEWVPDAADANGLAARLADVIDEGPTHACRVIAIALVARLEVRSAAVAALRRALALPSFAVRAHALHALATARPCAIEPSDLVQVLRDLVTHAVPDALSDDEHEENERVLADAVLTALEHVRPDEAAEALLDWIDAEHDTLWLDAGWATEALAVAFPEAAAAMVDYWLKCVRAYDRTKALAALERLPDDLVKPRLLLAASDPVASVREPARQKWLQRFAATCPVDTRAIVGGALLGAGQPTDRFVSRLIVMHGRVPQARLAMARALMAEDPSPESLVLLLQLVADDSVSSEPLAPQAAPSGGAGSSATPAQQKEWATVLIERFGALGVEGLCALAARFPEPEVFGWMRRLGDLVESGVLAREFCAPLRALAARHVASEEAGLIDDSLRLLALVGAPPELLDRALGLALDVDLASSAVRELIVAWPDRAVDRRLVSEMALAVAERDWARVQCAASVALGRGSPAARVIAQRVLEVAAEDEGAIDAAVECAHRLRSVGALDDEWAIAALGRPDSPIFIVAARVWRRSGAVRGALEAVLASPARQGASGAEAAIALLSSDPPLSPRDRRLAVVLSAAPLLERAELVHAMCVHGAPLTIVAPHLDELLGSADAGVAQALVGVAHWLRSPKGLALLRKALPRVVDPELRADIEEQLGTTAVPYWVDG
jgi:hypothetical protein